MTTTVAPANGREAARFMEQYAKAYGAGAFAMPQAKEIEAAMARGGPRDRVAGEAVSSAGSFHWWDGVAAYSRLLTRTSTRTDFTGRKIRLPIGARVITHMATEPGAELPSLEKFDWVFAYIEDRNITDQLTAQGREVRAMRVSAASELIACWGRRGDGHRYPAVDEATIVRLPLEVGEVQRRMILDELSGINSWIDDFPYYSDGSWDAVSLRGFNPADSTWGIKPSEMSKSWWREHPEAKQYTHCGWTPMAERCEQTTALVQEITRGWGELERVRLLRMQGRDGKGGSLSRHTDVTDRAAGTRDGQIIRFHVPLITDPRITMSGWNLRGERHDVHLPAWTLWYLDARKPHAVDNRAGIDRIHLVIDVEASPATRRAIVDGEDAAA